MADACLQRLKAFCQSLEIAPHRGEPRPELKEGQRTIGFEHRITIVFRVYDDQQLVRITGMRYAGRGLHQTK